MQLFVHSYYLIRFGLHLPAGAMLEANTMWTYFPMNEKQSRLKVVGGVVVV